MDVKSRVEKALDSMAANKADPRIAWALLASAMVVSAAYCLYMTRGTTFTGDEITWVSFAPHLDLRTSFEPQSGHLIFVTFWVYKAILETIGSDYLTFRLLTLGAVYLAVTLLFLYSRRRVGDFVALAPCLVLLFFGNDAGNMLQGIGFTIMLAVSLGMVSLLALQRNSLAGDICACAALTVAVLSFTLALPFLAGAIVAVLIRENRWRRIWVFAIPLAVYLAWRIWLVADDVDTTAGSAHLTYLNLLPSWVFQSLSGILSALTGFNYDFTNTNWLPPGEMAGPALALGFLVLIGWRIRTAKLDPWFWVVMAVALALFASQVVGWIPDVRTPATSRYLFPGAFVVILVLVEAFRGYPVSRTTFVVIWILALCGLATNIGFIRDSGRAFRDRAVTEKTEMTAANLVTSAYPYPPGANARPLTELVTEPGFSITADAEAAYGGLGLTEAEIAGGSPELTGHVDSIFSSAFGLGLVPATDAGPVADPGSCRYLRSGPGGAVITEVPKGGAVLRSRQAGAVSLRRFSPGFTVSAGQLNPGQAMNLYIPADSGTTPWHLRAEVPSLLICGF